MKRRFREVARAVGRRRLKALGVERRDAAVRGARDVVGGEGKRIEVHDEPGVAGGVRMQLVGQIRRVGRIDRPIAATVPSVGVSPSPSCAAASRMLGRFIRTSWTRLPGMRVIHCFAGSI